MQEYSSSQEEVVTEGKTNTQVDEIKNLRLNQLINFKDHPFKVETNTELFVLMQSIEKDGVLVPLLARPNPNGEGYELISGHRRKAACEWAGVTINSFWSYNVLHPPFPILICKRLNLACF